MNASSNILISLAFVFTFFSVEIKSQNTNTYDPVIQTIVNAVNGDTIWDDISKLVILERYSINTTAIQSSNFLKGYFTGLGFDTVFFQNYQSGYIPNVIAVKYGTIYPDSVIVIGAHYDVYASGAPGADDNGSGTAAVMETGRVIAGYNFKRTIKLVCFSGEEEGLYGSTEYANTAFLTGEKIKAVITMDMIAYLKAGDQINSDVYYNNASLGLRNTYAGIASLYIPGFTVSNATYPTGAGSDVEPFWNNGYKAIFPCEGQFSGYPQNNHCSPYIHTSDDILGVSANSKTQAEKITQSVVATLATLAELKQQTGIINAFPAPDNSYISVCPNPATSEIKLNYYIPENEDIKLSIYNIFGEVIKTFYNTTGTEGLSEIVIPVLNLQNGIYFIYITSKNFYINKKIIVSR